ncbi:hypothetical protein D6817_04570 [Candidatus Pacearchaeota archaeon]|nr:MAG: hypothetical protein D6817_04570 [Candidatus Pacearchaeota archaeon]
MEKTKIMLAGFLLVLLVVPQISATPLFKFKKFSLRNFECKKYDLNQDGKVDYSDLIFMRLEIARFDQNSDRQVDINDYKIISLNRGASPAESNSDVNRDGRIDNSDLIEFRRTIPRYDFVKSSKGFNFEKILVDREDFNFLRERISKCN